MVSSGQVVDQMIYDSGSEKLEFNDPLSVNHYTLTFFICEMNLNIPAKSNIWKFDIPFDPLNEIYPKEITREVAEI